MMKKINKLFFVGLLVVACGGGAPVSKAFASSNSEMLRTKAVLHLLDDDYAAALRKLTSALRLDTSDMVALYYRGIVHSRMGNFEQAVSDMEQAGKSGVYFEKLDFELGYAYLFDGRLDEALDTLYEAQIRFPNHAPSKYYLGLVYYQKQEYSKAIQLLTWARDLDASFGPSSAYLVGDAHYKNAESEKATAVLVAALKDYPDSIYRKPIEDLLRLINKAPDAGKNYGLTLAAGVASDTNVGLLPETDLVSSSDLADTKTHLNIDASKRVYSAFGKVVRVGINLSQNSHAKLDEYDFQKSVIYSDLQDNRQGWAWGGHVELGQSKLASNTLYNSLVFMPYTFLHHSPANYSLLSFQLRDVDYELSGEEGRSSYYYEGLYRYYFLPAAKAGTRFSIQGLVYLDDTADSQLLYNGVGMGFGLEYEINKKHSVDTLLEYRNRDYPDSTLSRTVDRLDLGARYEYQLMQSLAFLLDFGYTNSSSNDSKYDYDRLVLGAQLQWVMQ